MKPKSNACTEQKEHTHTHTNHSSNYNFCVKSTLRRALSQILCVSQRAPPKCIKTAQTSSSTGADHNTEHSSYQNNETCKYLIIISIKNHHIQFFVQHLKTLLYNKLSRSLLQSKDKHRHEKTIRNLTPL